MKKYFEGLRPFERRVIIFVGVVLLAEIGRAHV